MTKLPDFSKRSIDERIDTVVRLRDLNAQEEDLLRNSFNGISREQADNAIENCICGNPLMGIVTNARINNKDYLIPLVTEEPSIVAGASRAFKLGRDAGIEAQSTRNLLVGQIKLINVTGKEAARETLRKNTDRIIATANEDHAYSKAIEIWSEPINSGLVVYLTVNTGNTHGANTVTKMCERIAPLVEECTGGKAVAKIVSNMLNYNTVHATMNVPVESLARNGFSGKESLEKFMSVAEFAREDKYRNATHNKGIMNGVIGVASATGQDTRAIYSAAMAYVYGGQGFAPLSHWIHSLDGLEGTIRMPLTVATVGGATQLPYNRLGLRILGVQSAPELQEVMAATGLACNFAAIHELATNGMRGHFRLQQKRNQ
ncbi:MAG TPA: 3-hydroxy-3-methylglutaryl-CoA reductase [Candidatus Nanoarchaeia archaeon]|nr:3-hydroxy-3-methylglutaryl-CoA reductase [Candidatus Nanoarchaeia archaeon]